MRGIQHVARGAAWRAAIGSALLLLAGGCKVVGAKVANLDALHENDGSHVRMAVLLGDVEYTLHHGLFRLVPGREERVKAKQPRPIKNPPALCLENLLGLVAFDPNNSGVAERQVEMLSFIAERCVWKLSRRAAVEALGKAAQRLEVGEHPDGRGAGGETAAAPAEVAEALRSVIQAVDKRGPGAAELPGACSAVAALELDSDGARRSLRTAAILLDRVGAADPRYEPLRDLSRDLQRWCIRLAIASALADASPLVRAEAVAADVRGGGMERLAEHYARLDPNHPRREADPEVIRRVLELIGKRGLPGLGSAEDPLSTERSLALLYALSTRHPDSRVRSTGMRTLERCSGAEIASLREEDWQDWWVARREGRDAPRAAAAPANKGENGP